MLNDEDASDLLHIMSRRVFPVERIPVRFSEDDARYCVSTADRIHQQQETNKQGMTPEQKLKQVIRGHVTEKALCSLLLGSVQNLREFNVNDPSTYDHDVVWHGLKFEMKSMPYQYRHWNCHSYVYDSSNTMRRAITHDNVALIVGGFVFDDENIMAQFEKREFVATVDWFINPAYYEKHGVKGEADGLNLIRFGRDSRLRVPPYATWKKEYDVGR